MGREQEQRERIKKSLSWIQNLAREQSHSQVMTAINRNRYRGITSFVPQFLKFSGSKNQLSKNYP